MTRKMIINAVDPDEVRIAIVNNGILEEFDIEARATEKNKGNIYYAVVKAVEPALNAAFVDYGADKQGFLTAHDVNPKLAGLSGTDKSNKIEDLLKPRQQILVQVSKDEVGTKGAVLTTYLSLAGRYLVLMPDSERQGVSRKIENEETRKRMREAAAMLAIPEGMGVIIRTAGKDRTKADLTRDLKHLLRLWENIQKEANSAKAPALIFKEQDVIIRALRDYFSSDIDEIVLDSDEAFDRASEYIHMVMPKHTSVLTRYVERRPIFHHYRIEEQLEALFTPKVPLPSGGSIVIQPTEALVSIDVNSGKQKSSDHEDTALQTNCDAAREVARQLRLRDLGGIIVIDFIDMMQRKNQQKVERVLKEALKVDKARVKLERISRNGTLELTRQRIRTALQSTMFQACSVCGGTGQILNTTSHAINILRRLRDRAARGDLLTAKVRVEPRAANVLRTEKWAELETLQQRYDIRIDLSSDPSLRPGEDDFTFEKNPDAEVLPMAEPNFGPAPRLEEYGGDGADMLDDDEFEDVEEDEMAYDNTAGEERTEQAARRGRRRRRTQRTGAAGKGGMEIRAEGVAQGDDGLVDDDTLDLPTFEFLDPAAVAGRHRRRPARDEAAGHERRVPRARAGRSGNGPGVALSADAETTPMAAGEDEGAGNRRGRQRRRRRRRGGGQGDVAAAAVTAPNGRASTTRGGDRAAARRPSWNQSNEVAALSYPRPSPGDDTMHPAKPRQKVKSFLARLFGLGES